MPCKIKRKGRSCRSKEGPARRRHFSPGSERSTPRDLPSHLCPSREQLSPGSPFPEPLSPRVARTNWSVKVMAEFSQAEPTCTGTNRGSVMLQSWSDDEDPRSSWVEMGTRLQPPVTPLIPVLDSPLGPFLFLSSLTLAQSRFLLIGFSGRTEPQHGHQLAVQPLVLVCVSVGLTRPTAQALSVRGRG